MSSLFNKKPVTPKVMNFIFSKFHELKDAIERSDLKTAQRHLEALPYESLIDLKASLEEAKEILQGERLKFSDIASQVDLLEECKLDEADEVIELIEKMKEIQRKNFSNKDSKYDIRPLHSELKLNLNELDSSIDLWGYIIFQIRLMMRRKALS